MDDQRPAGAPDPSAVDESVYAQLVDVGTAGGEPGVEVPGDSAHWAFGTDFDDPLAGVDTSLPPGLDAGDAADLAAYCLMLGDDALVASHRLSEWCSHAPDLEEDIALANIALDLLGQARLLLARAAAADASVVPRLPGGSPVPAEDALAFFREADELRNLRLVEAENGDFAETVVRLLVLATVRLAVLGRLTGSGDPVLAAVAAKGVKELRYHRDWAGRWFVTLAGGTRESRRRLEAGLAAVWPLVDEACRPHPVEERLAALGVAADLTEVRGEVDRVLGQVLDAADLPRPGPAAMALVGGRSGRDGVHTEALSRMLATMQVMARAHPEGLW